MGHVSGFRIKISTEELFDLGFRKNSFIEREYGQRIISVEKELGYLESSDKILVKLNESHAMYYRSSRADLKSFICLVPALPISISDPLNRTNHVAFI